MVSETNALNFYSIPEISLLDLVVFSVAAVVLQTSPAPRGWMNLQTGGATVRNIGVLCKANFCSFRDESTTCDLSSVPLHRIEEPGLFMYSLLALLDALCPAEERKTDRVPVQRCKGKRTYVFINGCTKATWSITL